MNGNFRWHYVKDGEYPENTGKNREALILVKQLLPKNPDDGTLVETFTSCFYSGFYYYAKGKGYHRFVDTLYGYEANGVVAWCYLKDVYEQLNNTGWGFDPDREANDADNT